MFFDVQVLFVQDVKNNFLKDKFYIKKHKKQIGNHMNSIYNIFPYLMYLIQEIQAVNLQKLSNN